MVPVVRFLNGREEITLPERFESTVVGCGKCWRVQARTTILVQGCLSILLGGILSAVPPCFHHHRCR